MKKTAATLVAILYLSFSSYAQNADKFWLPVNEAQIEQSGKRQIFPQKYVTFKLNGSELKTKLFSAPNEKTTPITASSCILTLPLPNGTLQRFKIVESPVMDEALSAKYPNIKSFSVDGIDDAYAHGKLDWNEFGFHGMIITPAGDFFIDPYCLSNITDYISYYTADFTKDPSQVIPEAGLITNTPDDNTQPAPQKKSDTGTGSANKIASPAICVGDQLRTYRLAVACTGEYAQAATGSSAPTIAQTLSKVHTSVNRVDGVYETEVAVRMVLIANDTLVLFTNPSTDPFNGNNNANTLITESHSVITYYIGSANFDIGHTFSTGGGGLANLGCVCHTADKGKGITGSASPVGDPYDIDYVAHEMGHQFGGNHTFNAITASCGGGNRNASTSVEPGSGVTIMAYAGICGANDNLAQHSIAYFHGISYDEIVNYTHSNAGGNSCAVTTSIANQPPVVTGSGDYTIPKSTPFYLTGSATDPDNNALTYSWEETDPGPTGGTWNTGTKPFFRSYAPVTTPTRYFPLATVVAIGNYTNTRGEYLPTTAQTLQFRLTARDGHDGVCYAINNITVDDSGPFNVTYPSATGIIWGSGTQQVVTWDVNNTDLAPVSCVYVTISISFDNGATYTPLLSATANDGSETIAVPTVTADITTCRIKVSCDDNIFYDMSNNKFTITLTTDIKQLSQNNQVGLAVWPNPFNSQVNISASSLNASSLTKLSVVDVLGKTVLQTTYTAKTILNETIDLSGISPGVYFIKVNNDNKQSVYRVIKD